MNCVVYTLQNDEREGGITMESVMVLLNKETIMSIWCSDTIPSNQNKSNPQHQDEAEVVKTSS
jgi:hypothetical protein